MTYTPLRTPRHAEVNVRGLKHRLTWWGPPSGQPIVLLHGFQDCGDTWQFLVDCLPQDWSLVAPDWRGFGGSDRARGGYWFPDYLADLEALLEQLVPQAPARIISHSMGANVAGLYAGVRPDRLQWLVNLEGIGLPRTSPETAPDRYAQWLDEIREPLVEGRYASVQQLADVLVRRNPRLTADRAQFVARAWTREAQDAEGGVPRLGACLRPGACVWRLIRDTGTSILFCIAAKRRRPVGRESESPCCSWPVKARATRSAASRISVMSTSDGCSVT